MRGGHLLGYPEEAAVSVCVEDADYQGLIVGGLNMRRRLRTPP